MKKTLCLTILVLFASTFVVGCRKSDVPSGTYTGTLEEVNPDEREIYVKTDDGRVLELYFTDDTVLEAGGVSVGFEALEEAKSANAKVTVEVENADGELIPNKVTISQ